MNAILLRFGSDDTGESTTMLSDNEILLQQVHALRTMLIDVGTGIKRIQDVEVEYTQLRGEVAQKLRAHRIIDVNGFFHFGIGTSTGERMGSPLINRGGTTSMAFTSQWSKLLN
jgi:hypothetical protein